MGIVIIKMPKLITFLSTELVQKMFYIAQEMYHIKKNYNNKVFNTKKLNKMLSSDAQIKSKGSSLTIPVFDPEKLEINVMENK